MNHFRFRFKHYVFIWLLVGSQPVFSDENGSFWQWFEKNEARYFNMDFDNVAERDKLFADLSEQFLLIDDNLTFEFGKLDEETMDFVISAGGIISSFPAVTALTDAAPKFKRWKITPFRQRKEETASIEIGDLTINVDNTLVQLFEDGDKIGVVLYLPGFTDTPNDIFEQIGFLLLDQTLGEYVVGTQVGFVEFEVKKKIIQDAMPLSEISKFFNL